jgi:hypothetical protein
MLEVGERVTLLECMDRDGQGGRASTGLACSPHHGRCSWLRSVANRAHRRGPTPASAETSTHGRCHPGAARRFCSEASLFRRSRTATSQHPPGRHRSGAARRHLRVPGREPCSGRVHPRRRRDRLARPIGADPRLILLPNNGRALIGRYLPNGLEKRKAERGRSLGGRAPPFPFCQAETSSCDYTAHGIPYAGHAHTTNQTPASHPSPRTWTGARVSRALRLRRDEHRQYRPGLG